MYMTQMEAKQLAARLIGSFSSKTLDPKIYAVEVARKLVGYNRQVGLETVEELLRTETFIPSIKLIIETLDLFVGIIETRNKRAAAPNRRVEHHKKEITPEGWDAPGVRNQAALSGMMRLLTKTIASKDAEMHQKIIDVNRDPANWPAFLDTHGDSEWKQREVMW